MPDWGGYDENAYEVIWRPQPGPQVALLSCPADVILTGGARGGGKTSSCIGHWIAHAGRYGSAARGIFLRRRYKNLEEVQRQLGELLPKLGATYSKGEALWTMSNGATLKLRHLWDADAAGEYLGHSYSVVYAEELTQWPDLSAIDKMVGTLRSSEGVRCQLIATANPGGPGHQAVKRRFVDPAPRGYVPIIDQETGLSRVFIPSRLEDNPILMQNDPLYEKRLLTLGNPELVKAWRYGEWDITFGGMFSDVWLPDRQVLRPFNIPQGWTFRRSFDWGSSAPFSLGLHAISDGSPVYELQGRVFPRGSIVRLGEWYGVARDSSGQPKANQGLTMANTNIGRGIVERSREYRGRPVRWSGCVADPSIFSEHGRESIYVDLQRGAREIGGTLTFDKADNNRVAGWTRMRDYLEESAKDTPERPGLWVFENCVNWLRTVPTLQRDESNGDDVETTQEDHCGDEQRYLIMSQNKRGSVSSVYF
jgi:Terminase large subunit, T4likevirus-type, N-terminal